MKTLYTALLLLTITTSSFAQRDAKKKNEVYGKNIFNFMPVYVVSDNNIGVGASYERLVNDYVGLRVPVMFGINGNYTNIALELKLYPARNNGPAKYAIAPTIMYGTGQENKSSYIWDPITNQYVYRESKYNRSHFGFLLNQTFNFTIMKNFFIGMDGGLGINYFDNNSNRNYNNGSNNSNITFLGQFQMAIGCRF